jgi:hypothetical protein
LHRRHGLPPTLLASESADDSVSAATHFSVWSQTLQPIQIHARSRATSPVSYAPGRRFANARDDRAEGSRRSVNRSRSSASNRRLAGAAGRSNVTGWLYKNPLQTATNELPQIFVNCWCGREDSNLHDLAIASPSSWCVCRSATSASEELPV